MRSKFSDETTRSARQNNSSGNLVIIISKDAGRPGGWGWTVWLEDGVSFDFIEHPNMGISIFVLGFNFLASLKVCQEPISSILDLENTVGS